MSRDGLSPERRALVERLFDEALDQPSLHRDAWLDEACGDDAALKAELAALLASAAREGILDRPVERPERPVVGPWHLDSRIGHGGMGEVWLADRGDGQYRQRAAIKVIRSGLDVIEVRRRFLMERQILAGLDHPNIAHLLDGGVTGDGRPYIAMEFVDGTRIDRWCDTRQYGVAERIRLLIPVARAVHYAHRNLVVHRDLKPSNILVTGDGVPKLLDFGIAKLLGGSGDTTGVTETGLHPMTPEYASPEQLRGQPLTTASDVYSLGVVLHELLTGRVPFAREGRAFGEWERDVLEREPDAPSSVSVPGAAEARGTTPERLRAALSGDLDRILLMCLRKEPDRRYASAEQLAADLERFLADEPVLAHGADPAYRLRKFVSRHRTAVAVIALAAAAVLGSAATSAWQAGVARRERDRAELEARKATQAAGMLADIFRLSDPTQARGDTITARRLLEEGRARVERELADEPDLQSHMLRELAGVYYGLGLLPAAESLASRSLDLRRRQPQVSPEELAASEALLGRISLSRGRPERAVDLLGAAVARRGAMVRGPDSVLTHMRAAYADALQRVARYDQSAAEYRTALAEQRALWGDRHPRVALTAFGLAAADHQAGRISEAESLLARTVAQIDSGDVASDPDLASALLGIGTIRRLREDYRGAERPLALAMRMREERFGPRHLQSLGARTEYALLLMALDRLPEAVRLLREGVAIASEMAGPMHPTTSNEREALASALYAAGDHAASSAAYDSVLAEKRQRYGGSDHDGVLYTVAYSGDPLLAAGRLDSAEARYREAIDIADRSGQPRHPYKVLALDGLGQIAQRRGNLAQAEAYLTQAADIARTELRPGHRFARRVTASRGLLLLDQGRADEARPVLEAALAAERAVYPDGHPRVRRLREAMGR